MRHDDVRTALVSDEPVPVDVREHLARCDACVSFARACGRLRKTAPLLGPAGPPRGLADRVAAAVAEAPAPLVVPATPLGQRVLMRVAIAILATLVVAVAAVTLRSDSPNAAVTLAAAARRTADAGTARLRVDGTTTFVLPARDRESVPAELGARASATTTVTVRGTGDVAFGDRLRLTGTVGVAREEGFDLVAARDGVAFRVQGDPWAVATSSGPWSAVVGGPDALVLLLQEATDVTVDAGEYRFRAVGPDGTAFTGAAIVDGRQLASVRLSASGTTGGINGAAWTVDVRVDLSRPGAPVAPAPVEVKNVRARTPGPDDASRVLYPFGPGVRAASDL